MPLGVRIEQVSRRRDRHFLTDAGDDILQRALLGGVIMNIVDRKDRAAVLARKAIEPLDPGIIVAAIKPARRDMAKRRQGIFETRQIERIEVVAGPGDEGYAVGVGRYVAQRQLALAFLGAHLAEAQEARQPAITLAVD